MGCRNLRATFVYDSVGNIEVKHQQGSNPMTFAYDAASRMVTMVQGTTLTTFTYDDTGNLTKEEKDTGALTPDVTTYAYDNENHLVRVQNPDGTSAAYAYDGDGLRRKAVVDTGTPQPEVTTFVWDGDDYLGEFWAMAMKGRILDSMVFFSPKTALGE